ncbi:TetR/AcrR family transcriptional regulator [Rhizomonospora bruguierae]|uniref:TetR/AcrR family transcriptional regulator n=1 Tax=Rhizomonospora bruguierae TaxID=1581705 RepID=UPI001BCA9AD8|nr:TetR/AcrR family transcriptional regulator [Micromonospora sp. NBRC 107566]
MPRPRSLTDTAIATAALAVIDRAGPDALSMRTVAKELGVGTMSLYRYVPDRGTVERLVVDLVLDGVDITPPPTPDWRAALTELIRRCRAAVRAHLAVVPLVQAHRHHSPGVLRWAEAMLAVLTDAGFAGRHRVVVFRAVLSYVIGALENEYRAPLAGSGTAAMAALPDRRHPFLAETARTAATIGPDEEFEGGLALLLAGIAATIDHS